MGRMVLNWREEGENVTICVTLFMSEAIKVNTGIREL